MENQNNLNTDEMREELPPLFGIFKMSRLERIVHASVFSLIGATYFAYVLWSRVFPGFKAEDITKDISTWQVMPCYLLSALILLSAFPLIRPRHTGRIYILTINKQQFFRIFLILLWLILYLENSQIIFILFYKYLPA